MATAILFLLALSVWHYVCESIVAPSLRMKLRNEVFEYRDQLRWIRMHDDRLDDDVFAYMQESLNNTIAYLHALKFSTLSRFAKALKNDPSLRARIQRRRCAINACPIAEVRDIDRKLRRATDRALQINAGGWLIFVVPIIVMIAIPAAIIGSLLAAPEHDARKLVSHDHELALA